jgi:hypothetical protein
MGFMASEYSDKELVSTRIPPMVDDDLYKFMNSCTYENTADLPNLIDDFKSKMNDYVFNNNINKLSGNEEFSYRDVCIGCTQYIDDLYQTYGYNNIMTLKNDYKYHWRLNTSLTYYNIDTLDPNKQLLIAMPFPYTGNIHIQMKELLDRCQELKIPVHIDSAWVIASKDIEFDYNHPAIQSFAISLSKGLALGSHRIGLRWSKSKMEGPISIMNEFNMNCKSLVWIGLKFMEKFEPGYLWKKYENHYNKIIEDFNLQPTNALHLAIKDDKPVGIRSLLLYLEYKEIDN